MTNRCRASVGSFVFAAVACVTQAAAAQTPAAPSAPTTWSSPWGGTLVPEGMPRQPRLPVVQPARPSSGGLVQPTPAFASPGSLNRAEPISTNITPPNVEPLHLDHLLPPQPPEIRVAGLTENTIAPMNEVLAEPQPQLPPGARDGVFQKIYFTGTWLPPLSEEPDSLGFGDLEMGVVFGFPFFRRDTPLLVTPQFGTHLLDNSAGLDIPTTLYDASIEFRHLRKFGAGPWAMDAAVNVGYFSDFEQDSGDALRITGRGIAVYERTPGTKWLLGVAYLNRAGASVMPVFGMIRDVDADLRLELIFPRPRVLCRTAGSVEGDERWVYVGGEFGGGVWSITRPSTGELEVMNYSDWRVLAGYERKITGGLSRRIELGYVFHRELEFDNEDSEFSLDDTLFLRGGLTY